MAGLTSESTIKRLAALEEFEEDADDDEGTLKRHHPRPHLHSLAQSSSPDWRTTLSPNRLSNLFDGWIRPSPPVSPTRISAIFVPDKKNVSEPKLLEHQAMNTSVPSDAGYDDLDIADFQKMVVSG